MTSPSPISARQTSLGNFDENAPPSQKIARAMQLSEEASVIMKGKGAGAFDPNQVQRVLRERIFAHVRKCD